MKQLLFFSIAVLLFGICYSQPGTLDVTFGNNGFVADNGFSIHNAVAQQTNGKLVSAGGYNDSNFNAKGNIARFQLDGTLDSSFGTNGFLFGNVSCFDMVLQPDDKILVIGIVYDGINPNSYAVGRYQPDGKVDSSFGENGVARIPSTNDQTQFNRIALAPDSSIIVAGSATPSSSLCHISSNGVFDSKFGGTGRVLNTIVGFNARIAVQKDGKILLTGNTFGGGYYEQDFALSRYNPDGSLDETFGSGGTVVTQGFPGVNGHDQPGDIVVQADGRIVMGGYSTGSDYIGHMAILRYNPDGTLDNSFGTKGKTFVLFENEGSAVATLLPQSDGKILLSGNAYNYALSRGYLALSRLNDDGSIDSSFAVNGKQTTAFGEGDAGTTCALLQADGKIVQGGSYFNEALGSDSYLLARYNNDISRRQQIITRIRRWLQHHGITWQGDNNVRYYTVQKSTDGGITYQPVAKLYNAHQSSLSYEEATANDNALYRVAATAKDGGRSLSNSIAIGSEAAIKLFPNPVRNTLQIQGLSTDSKTNITVTDFSGNVRTSTTANGGSVSINASTLKPGNYLLKVQSGGNITTHPFVKE